MGNIEHTITHPGPAQGCVLCDTERNLRVTREWRDVEVDALREQLQGAVALLREARGYVARHAGEKAAAELYDRIASALAEIERGQYEASPAHPRKEQD